MTLPINGEGQLTNISELTSSAVAQIIPGRLYFTSYGFNCNIPNDDLKSQYIDIEDGFYDDFGPVNLSVLYRFCKYLNLLLEKAEKENKRIFLYTSMDQSNRVNAAYLIASYLIIHKECSAEQAYLRLQAAEPPRFVGFRDAAMGIPLYLLHVQHVIQSVEKALRFKWLNFENFDPDEYEFYEKVENGDLNWIVPGKVLSFCGPHDKAYTTDNGYPYHSPDIYFDYFHKNGVTTIIRLNKKIYEASRFTNAGFDHYDLFFIDGTTPSDDIVLRFIEVMDSSKGAVAVHCKAGLGRTGTLIACWMMKHFRLTAPQCMGWLRICRPGSVIGPQQQFLIEKQSWCWRLGCQDKHNISIKEDNKIISNNDVIENNDIYINEISKDKQLWNERKTLAEEDNNEKGKSQGDLLCEIKAARQHRQSSKQNSCRSSSIRLRSSEESLNETPILSPRSPETFEIDTVLEHQLPLKNERGESFIQATPIKQFKLSTTNPSYRTENKIKIIESESCSSSPIIDLTKKYSRRQSKNQRGGINKNLNTKIPIKKVSVSTNLDNFTIGGCTRSSNTIQRKINFVNSHIVKPYLPTSEFIGIEGTSTTAVSSFNRALTRQYAKINAIANERQAATKILDDSSKFQSPIDGPLSHQTNCKYELRPRSQLNTPSRFINNNISQKQHSRRSILTSKVETVHPASNTQSSTSVAAFVSRL
ncbi:hypothetical protein Mgra_00001937 [Meloidogyne graminicola]|uniref:protein-tyrosine-phosphatase n=1 Tax=Meloidogyne graminicola TaxID=189291 RepID=A0A8S9ZZL5_9BILA|nr:hypothetical protein Mgra_00001937 [Meloidogyne graminicola]